MKKILKFKLNCNCKLSCIPGIFNAMNHLNEFNWMGYEPETCKIVDIQQVKAVVLDSVAEFEILVEYRPKGYITLDKGGCWFDGWKLKHLDIMRDGTLLDGKGNPLPAGDSPVILEFTAYANIDFNQFDFGQLVSEN